MKGYKDWSVELFDNKIESLTGYKIDKFNSGEMKWIDIIVEEDIETARKIFIQALKTDKSYVREYRIKSKSGKIIWTQERGQIVCDSKGEIEYIAGVFFDITEHRQAEEALQKSEEMHRILTENIDVGMTIIGTDYKVQWVNPVVGKWFDKDPSEFVGKYCYQEFEKSDSICHYCPAVEAIATGKPNEAETQGVKPDGSTFFVRDRVYPIIKDGKVIAINEIIEDITEKQKLKVALEEYSINLEKLVEERTAGLTKANEQLRKEIDERKRAEEALMESEEKHRTLFESSRDAIMTLAPPTWLFTSGNPATVELFKVKDEAEFISLGPWQLSPERQPDGKPSDEKAKEMIETAMRNGSHFFEWTHCHSDGTPFQAEVLLTRMEQRGQVLLQATVRDITESKRAEEALRESEARLQQSQKMESIGTLAGGIAHDFNNILFPIIGYAEMMLDSLPADSPHRNSTNEILQGGKRAGDLVKQILTFSRQADQTLKPLKVQLVIKEVLKLIRSSLPSTIEIKKHISNKCGLVLADATQIHQIAMNLITNAYHAMEDEGGKLEVTLKEVELGIDDLTDPSMTPGAHVCLTVSDTGPGMDHSVISRVFEPYFTTKEIGKGTGMGLSVVHGIVKSYKGAIKVYSEPGEGTAFHAYLPVIKSQFETEEADAVVSIPKGTERILLVDDEETIVRMEKQLLERLGYYVTARTSSVEALEAFRDSPGKFDLVITDMTMPNMTGVQLSQKLLEVRPDIPIIICTGFSTKIDNEKTKEYGIRGFVMKPVIMSEIAKKIREVLDQD